MVRFDNSISCSCLVLTGVDVPTYGGKFLKTGEKAYRRIGTGNFGKLISMLKTSDLVLTLGTYANLPADPRITDVQGQASVNGFTRKEVGMQEFVLI